MESPLTRTASKLVVTLKWTWILTRPSRRMPNFKRLQTEQSTWIQSAMIMLIIGIMLSYSDRVPNVINKNVNFLSVKSYKTIPSPISVRQFSTDLDTCCQWQMSGNAHYKHWPPSASDGGPGLARLLPGYGWRLCPCPPLSWAGSSLILIPAASIGAEWGHLSVQSLASAGLIKIWVAEIDQMGGSSISVAVQWSDLGSL